MFYQESPIILALMDMTPASFLTDPRPARIPDADSLRLQLETLDQIAIVIRSLAGNKNELHLFADASLIDSDTKNLLASLNRGALDEISDDCAALTQLMTAGISALHNSHQKLTATRAAGERPINLTNLAAATLYREILRDVRKLARNIHSNAR